MNNLVAYDADSDDESPRRRSSDATAANWAKEEKKVETTSKDSSGERKRRDSDMFDDDRFSPRDRSSSERSNGSNSNFAEPPPPKRMAEHSPSPAAFRTPQNAMTQNSSQVSLVSYSGDGEEEIEASKSQNPDSSTKSELHEPQPPARKSQDDDSDDEEERLIDLALEEGKRAMSKIEGEASPAESESSAREGSIESGNENEKVLSTKSQDVAEPNFANDDEIRIPPPPDVEVSERLQATFEAAFRQKSRGVNLNRQIQARQDFSNPMSYERFIEMFEIDEKGTNFGKSIFDPHTYPDNCYYDKIGEEQRKAMEAQQTANAKKTAK